MFDFIILFIMNSCALRKDTLGVYFSFVYSFYIAGIWAL